MSSRAGLNIFAKLQMQNTANTKEEVRSVQLSLDNISEGFAQMPARERQLQNVFGTAINAVSTLQLLRYGMNDIKQIAEGKGGIGDILSLTTTSIITLFRVNQLLQSQIVLQTALNAARAIGLALGGIAPATLAIGAIGIGYLGVQAYGQYAFKSMYDDQRLRAQAYRSIVGQ